MASTIIEEQRQYHEELERLQEAMTAEKLHKYTTHRENINSEHSAAKLFKRMVHCTEENLKNYEDKDGIRKREMDTLGGPNEFQEFYLRLRQIKEYHKKYPNEVAAPMVMEFMELKEKRDNPDENEELVEFTDEEGYGKYLDLHEAYEMFINIKHAPKLDYLTYLTTYDRFFEFPKDRKMNLDYKKYLRFLADYLIGFLQKINPLLNLKKENEHLLEDFEQRWATGTFQGWSRDPASAMKAGNTLDLSPFDSYEELASLGLDRLKSSLQALNLKCGGTLMERAQRLYATKGRNIDDLDPSVFAKSRKNKDEGEKQKEVAQLEAFVYHYTELLSEQRVATRENVERRQARTADELEDEDEDDEDDDNSEDDDAVPYNPKNLPLGWDGKPIPYWLYKLHGLNLYFNCEICGNFKYRGPKAFQRHFAEWRHAHGMRCLGIPNTAHFANVTLIEDARALWEKIKCEKTKERFQKETEEEFEDSIGNVVSKKVFDDLKRQGLL